MKNLEGPTSLMLHGHQPSGSGEEIFKWLLPYMGAAVPGSCDQNIVHEIWPNYRKKSSHEIEPMVCEKTMF